MAKKDGKKTGKAPGRIPKHIGGIKIPKEARKAGERLIDRATSPEGQRMIAQGLAMAATVAATAAARKANAGSPPSPAAPPSPPTPPAPPRPGEGGTASVDPHQVADAIGQAADAFFSKLFGARRPG